MKAIILAAGEGTRLRPFTLDRPKCLVEIEGCSLLDRQLAVLRSEGINPIITIGGYRVEMLNRSDVELRINPRFSDTNMVWTLFCAEEDIENDFILSYGDIVYSQKILQSLLNSSHDIAVVIDLDWEDYWRNRSEDPLDDAETLKLDSNGQIIEIGHKPKSLNEIEGQYIGLMKFSAKGAETLRNVFHAAKSAGTINDKPVENAYMTDLLQAIIDSDYSVGSVPVHGEWIEVDTVSDLNADITRSRFAKIDEYINSI